MAESDPASRLSPLSPPRWLTLFLILGLYLSLRGYHSRDGDQAYRLPLLLHLQDPTLFADDPFVRAFDGFNPHRGYLTLLDFASRPLGLSAAIFSLFVLTFAATCIGLDRLARAVWPESGKNVGLVAIGLALTAKAGNIGTIHLFEAMLLDRLIGLALGWLALAWAVERPGTHGPRAAIAIGLAALVHPSVGLQLAMVLGASWVAWAIAARSTGIDGRRAILGLSAIGLAVVPGVVLTIGQSARLFQGLTPEEFRLLSVELQNPQHMLPHLWRLPQWLAFGCYPVLALLALGRPGRAEVSAPWPAARMRLALLLAVNLAGVGLAWVAVEVLHDLRVTVFQPFRMATLFRGLAIVAVSGRVLGLWRDGRLVDRSRAVMIATGMAGDGMLVVATAIDVSLTTVEAALDRGFPLFPLFDRNGEGGGSRVGEPCARGPGPPTRQLPFRTRSALVLVLVFGIALSVGLAFISRHDTESGHVPLLAALGASTVLPILSRGRAPGWTRRRLIWALAVAWAVPLAALVAANGADLDAPWAAALVNRCRFAAVPTDDMERLAVWCRTHTPPGARFIGPPGPKTFRLWSLRSLAFNRAASPYHAAGLADWAARFRDHVGLDGPAAELVRAYQDDRHGLERRYQGLREIQRAALAVRQGARYVVADPPDGRSPSKDDGPLELLHVEGRYAVYRVREPGAMTPGPRHPRPNGLSLRPGPP